MICRLSQQDEGLWLARLTTSHERVRIGCFNASHRTTWYAYAATADDALGKAFDKIHEDERDDVQVVRVLRPTWP